jgi:hypothetical protein
MKINKSVTLVAIVLFIAVSASAQTADEIIGKYVQAIGGKDMLAKIKSVYTEGSMEVMGMQIIVKSTILNGTGMRQDMEVSGSTITNCINDKGGWTINPMTGSSSAEAMPEAQYKSGRDEIVVGAPFTNYAEKGYKVELVGNEPVGDVTAFKVKMSTPDNTSSMYFFDPKTFYLIKTVQQTDMQGQTVENVITFSDFRQVEGYTLPYKISTDMAGGQFSMAMTVTKVELNKPVDEAIFAKPQ